jgi:ATP-binding cassette subfamily F protein 3
MMKLMAGLIKEKAGKVSIGQKVGVSYFSQHQMELLSPNNTVLEEILGLPTIRTEREARSLLGAFLFSGDDVEKLVQVLSGGEKSRLVLARLMANPGNLLLMDEPTNHLDIEACEVLKLALIDFKGTLVVITHDRDLINRVADSVLYVDGGEVVEYPGGYDAFLKKRSFEETLRSETLLEESSVKEHSLPAQKGKDARRRDAAHRQKIKTATSRLRKEVDSLEGEVEESQKRLLAVEEELTMPEVFGDPAKVALLARERKELEEGLIVSMSRWENTATELEELEESFRSGGRG